MSCGGGVGGFIATRDEERYAREYPTLLVSLFDTIEPGERGFGLTLFEQNSYGSREHGKDWTGNSVYLWTVANAVYMALLGPQGFAELGELILQQSHYAARRLDELPGVARALPRRLLQGVRRRTSTAPARRSPRSTARCARAASSAATTSRRAFPRSGRARSTA